MRRRRDRFDEAPALPELTPLPDHIVMALARGYLPKEDDVERLAAEVLRGRIAARKAEGGAS